MKKFKKLLSITLALLMVIFIPVQANAQTSQIQIISSIERSDNVNVSTVEAEGHTIIAEYNKNLNNMTITTFKNNVVIERLVIDLNQDKNDNKSMLTILNEETGKYRVSYQHTITNYEYEQWKYPNYNSGKGFFWFLTHISQGERDVYELVRDDSQYSTSINGYVDNVEVINSTEIIVGVSAAITIAAIILTGGTSAVVQAKIIAALEAIGVVGAVTLAQQYWQATQNCNRYWKEIFGNY
ncbi:MAG: hypothetical protein K0Q97_2515 [Bacillota bacterium]|jgi:hypothetical protein|nr:hypothetical protein [Bacillota bacterium]